MKNILNCLCTVLKCGKRLALLSFVSLDSDAYDKHTCHLKHSWHTLTLVKDDVKFKYLNTIKKPNFITVVGK